MRANHSLERIRQGKLALGTWLQLQSLPGARLLAAQGCFDWLMLDMEHSPIDMSTASAILSSIADVTRGRCTPLARLGSGTIDQIKHALDAGAQGVLVPMVNTAREAAEAVSYARFPPQGVRGGGGMTPHLGFATTRFEYTQRANAEILVAIQIETRQAIENLDSILEVPGLDVIFLGPTDLHISLGLPPYGWSDLPEFQQAVEKFTTTCRRHKAVYGTLCSTAAEVKERQEEGYTFLGLGTDTNLLLTAAGRQYGELFSIPEPPETWAGVTRVE
jgi:4-hydroxy-2-oxoheptanedioate aldolase